MCRRVSVRSLRGFFFTWSLWKTDVSYRFTIWMVLFLPLWTGRRGKGAGVSRQHWADLSTTCDVIWHLIRSKGQGQRQKGVSWSEESFHKGGKWERGSETRRSKGRKALIRVGFERSVSGLTDMNLDLCHYEILKLHLNCKMKNNRMLSKKQIKLNNQKITHSYSLRQENEHDQGQKH